MVTVGDRFLMCVLPFLQQQHFFAAPSLCNITLDLPCCHSRSRCLSLPQFPFICRFVDYNPRIFPFVHRDSGSRLLYSRESNSFELRVDCYFRCLARRPPAHRTTPSCAIRLFFTPPSLTPGLLSCGLSSHLVLLILLTLVCTVSLCLLILCCWLSLSSSICSIFPPRFASRPTGPIHS